MKIVESPLEAYAQMDHWRSDSLKVGLIPTMGALHPGHYSLVRRSVAECDVTAATIFVNPTQFGPNEDLHKYPRTLEEDLEGLRERGADLVFVPKAEDIYPPGFSSFVSPPTLAHSLEGEHRPEHFRGVVTVVLKLFHILPAHNAYFGQKDYQQLAVIRRMVDELHVPIRVIGCETIREEDGLAMSSRNRYLSSKDRVRALSLQKALARAQELVQAGCRSIQQLEEGMEEILAPGVDRIDYASIVDAETLQEVSELRGVCVALVAAYVGSTRLIDNCILDV